MPMRVRPMPTAPQPRYWFQRRVNRLLWSYLSAALTSSHPAGLLIAAL